MNILFIKFINYHKQYYTENDSTIQKVPQTIPLIKSKPVPCRLERNNLPVAAG